MNFQALLFCQDEKTARVTTQVLNELEFSVETSSEPFAAVKKLMGQHFDAVVVDCDNEQNASLLFKGARNSSLNQASLAVAVVEGQAGVANAFRIGANLVLTKPINIEQAKGTLRVARGLLKKGNESAKAAAPAQPVLPASPSQPVGTPLTAAAKASGIPSPAEPTVAAQSSSNSGVPAAPAKFAAATAMAKTSADSGNVLEVQAAERADEILLDGLEEDSPTNQPFSKPQAKPADIAAQAELTPQAAQDSQRPIAAPVFSTGGAASAPAPAKVPSKPELGKMGLPQTATMPVETHAPAAMPAPGMEAPGLFSQRQSVPTFAGLDQPESGHAGGAGKFAVIAIAVAALAAAAYFGYTKFHDQTPAPGVQQQQPTSSPELPLSNANPGPPSAVVTATVSKPNASAPQHGASTDAAQTTPHKTEPERANEEEPEVVVTKIEPEPRVVKANPGTPKPIAKSNPVEEEAPSALGAATGDNSEISNIVSSAPVGVPKPAATAPTMLKVSQGVTQGMLLKRVQPVYPHQALQMRIAGAVQLLAVINKEGSISSVKVLAGDPILARAATDAVSQWKYKPYMLDGEPVDIETQITVNFKLP